MPLLYDFSVPQIDGAEVSLARYRGLVVLVVNTASRCGFTPQYLGLEALYRGYRTRGFVVLGFPCNQFGRQAPGESGQECHFARTSYDVSFPLFAKVDVNGARAHPLFVWLTDAARGALGTTRIKWNFTKFLIGRDGRVIERFAPMTPPERLAPAIERALDEPNPWAERAPRDAGGASQAFDGVESTARRNGLDRDPAAAGGCDGGGERPGVSARARGPSLIDGLAPGVLRDGRGARPAVFKPFEE